MGKKNSAKVFFWPGGPARTGLLMFRPATPVTGRADDGGKEPSVTNKTAARFVIYQNTEAIARRGASDQQIAAAAAAAAPSL